MNSSPQQIRILAVVVLYRTAPGDSPTLRTLFEAQKEALQSGLELAVVIQDNTPGGQNTGKFPANVRYRPAPDNPGLARAYNWALEIADTEGYDWLLTLDQDTVLPKHFLARVAELATELEGLDSVAAIVPQVIGHGRNISPYRLALGAIPRWFRLGRTGILPVSTYAVNSAATLRVAALRAVGGYDPMFPLDISDISLFHRLHLHGKKVYLAGDLLVSHDFSMLRKQSRMSIQRYRSLLLDECAFYDIHLGALARLERMVRLAGRACKELLAAEESAFRRATLGELRRRIVTPRTRRIAEWKQWAAARSHGVATATEAEGSFHADTAGFLSHQ